MTGIRSVECLQKHRAETKHQNFTAINELADIYFIQFVKGQLFVYNIFILLFFFSYAQLQVLMIHIRF